MLKKNNVSVSPIIIVLLIAVCVAVIGFSLLSPLHYAYADETPYTPQIVNFNQIFNAGNLTTSNRGVTFTFTNNSSKVKFVVNNNTGAYYFAENIISLVVGHKYLIFTDNENFSIRIVGTNGNVSAYTNKKIVEYASGNVGILLKETTPNGTYYVNYNIIDLTQMGIDNYTIEQCNNLFIADYYSYNTGTPYFLYENAAAGQIAQFRTYKFAVNSGNLKNDDGYGSYAETNTSNGDLLLYTPINYTDENRAGFMKYNFNITIPAGAKVTIKADNINTLYNFSIWGGNTNSSFNDQWFTIYQSGNNSPLEKSVITSQSATYFHIWFYSNGSTSSPAIDFSNLRLEIEFTTNMNDLLQEAYDNGVSDTKTFYSEGNNGYEQIYQLGYNNGLANTNNVVGSAWDFISGSFTSLSSIFNLEVMPNITLGVFVAIPLLLGLLLFILKITRS